MANWIFNQYQVKAEPPAQNIQPGGTNEAPWHQPWSEPVRFKISKGLAIALAASGVFAPILTESQLTASIEARWHYPWSEPVRYKIDKRLAIALAASGPYAPVFDENTALSREMPWYAPLSEPVRLPKGLKAHLQQSFAMDTVAIPNEFRVAWFNWWSEPKRFKKGLGAYLQKDYAMDTQFSPNVNTLLQGFNWWSEPKRFLAGLKTNLQKAFFAPDRLLPTPNVTMTMAATEINEDVAIFAVNVYNSVGPITSGAGARVSIIEIAAGEDAAASIHES